MDFENYIPLRKISFEKLTFCYIDTSAHLADNIFYNHKIPIRFLGDYQNDDTEYEIVLCQISRKYKEKFLMCLDELKTKMLICNHTDYEEFCRTLMNAFEENRYVVV